MNPFHRASQKLPLPTIELQEVTYNGTTNRYHCRVRINGGPGVVANIAQAYRPGGMVQIGGRNMLVTDTAVSHGSDPNQIGKTVLSFQAIDTAQLAAGLNNDEPTPGNMRSARTGKPTDGAKSVALPKSFGPTARRLVL